MLLMTCEVPSQCYTIRQAQLNPEAAAFVPRKMSVNEEGEPREITLPLLQQIDEEEGEDERLDLEEALSARSAPCLGMQWGWTKGMDSMGTDVSAPGKPGTKSEVIV